MRTDSEKLKALGLTWPSTMYDYTQVVPASATGDDLRGKALELAEQREDPDEHEAQRLVAAYQRDEEAVPTALMHAAGWGARGDGDLDRDDIALAQMYDHAPSSLRSDELPTVEEEKELSGTEWLYAALERERVEMVSSKVYPSLERVPGKQNWLESVGGLPDFIEAIAKHVHYEAGKSIGHSIAIAVNAAKRMCATGDTNFPGRQQVGAASRARACKAVASWEAKKKRASNMARGEGVYTPSQQVAANAEWGLQAREKHGRGGTRAGVRRAQQLANREPLDAGDVKDVYSFFQRHLDDARAKGSESGGSWGDNGNPSPGWIAWNCLAGDTNILLADGSTDKLENLVASEENVEVLSFNETTGEIEPKPVIARYVTDCAYTDFRKVGTGSWLRTGYTNSANVTATDEHEFYSGGEWVRADEMEGRNLTAVIESYDPVAEQVIRGGLLGDGCLSGTGNARYAENHGSKQQEYLQEKARLLHPLGADVGKRVATSGYGARLTTHSLKTRSLSCLEEIRREYYVDGVKRVTPETLSKLTDLGLAVWVMDDGSLHTDKRDGRQHYRLHTEGFDKVSVDCLVDWLRGMGYTAKAHVRENTSGSTIYLSSRDTDELGCRIAPYVPESMRYKLPALAIAVDYSLSCYEPRRVYELRQKKTNVSRPISSYPRTAQDRGRLTSRYDIAVADNHNFIANGVIVHNCWGGNALRDKVMELRASEEVEASAPLA